STRLESQATTRLESRATTRLESRAFYKMIVSEGYERISITVNSANESGSASSSAWGLPTIVDITRLHNFRRPRCPESWRPPPRCKIVRVVPSVRDSASDSFPLVPLHLPEFL